MEIRKDSGNFILRSKTKYRETRDTIDFEFIRNWSFYFNNRKSAIFKTIYISIFLFLTQVNAFSQTNIKRTFNNSKNFGILFYNTENFYDIINDPKTDDDEFLPTSKYFWSKKRFVSKTENLYRAIISVGEELPAIIGLAEIENQYVLKQLTQQTPLVKFDYGIIHFDSPDIRGIDVGMLYRKELFRPLTKQAIRIIFPFDTARKTRDILYVKGIANTTDTLHIFINHWPSRRGGQTESNRNRNFVARTLRSKVDSIFSENENAKIVIVGDFNDEPDNESITNELKAQNKVEEIRGKTLLNLSYAWLKNTANIGTHKYKGNWGVLDQIIVSTSLLNEKAKGLKCKTTNARIVNSPFLLIEDLTYQGLKPFRTYNGFKYTGGFSDHLPIVLELKEDVRKLR